MNTRKEDIANALTHGFGVVIFGVLAPLLVSFTLKQGNASWPVMIFSFCLVMMYLNSALYHWSTRNDLKKKLRILDHMNIFLLIGGTFTPIVVYNMGSWNGLPFLAGFWAAMGGGVVYKLFLTGKYKLVSTLIYVGVAWAGAMLAWPLFDTMPRIVLIYLLIGGLFYTGGTIFYLKKQLAYSHAIWHLFVLAGSLTHYYAVYLSVKR